MNLTLTQETRTPLRQALLANQVGNELKPLLKWAGGKRWLVPILKPLWMKHSHCRLVEPFCGGLAIALGLLPEKALLNDINPHLINFYSWIREGLETTIEMKNESTTYYNYRERFNNLIQEGEEKTPEAAQIFYYLNRTGYNGLCRFNGGGKFNVPFGRYKTINVICLEDAIVNGKGRYKKAYLILGGEGWRLRDFYISGGLNQYLKYGNIVQILSLESFIAKANKGEL